MARYAEVRRSPSAVQRHPETTDPGRPALSLVIRGGVEVRGEEAPGSGARLHGPSRRYCKPVAPHGLAEILPRAGYACQRVLCCLVPLDSGPRRRATSSHRNVPPMKAEPADGVQAGGDPLGFVPSTLGISTLL
jgi:hypothetical protein